MIYIKKLNYNPSLRRLPSLMPKVHLRYPGQLNVLVTLLLRRPRHACNSVSCALYLVRCIPCLNIGYSVCLVYIYIVRTGRIIPCLYI